MADNAKGARNRPVFSDYKTTRFLARLVYRSKPNKLFENWKFRNAVEHALRAYNSII
jgi:hypothetical protein